MCKSRARHVKATNFTRFTFKSAIIANKLENIFGCVCFHYKDLYVFIESIKNTIHDFSNSK